MTHTETSSEVDINAQGKLDAIDNKLSALYLEIGKLDALASLIDLSSDDTEWQRSERCQFAIYLCCGLIEKVFQDFSDTHEEYQKALSGLVFSPARLVG